MVLLNLVIHFFNLAFFVIFKNVARIKIEAVSNVSNLLYYKLKRIFKPYQMNIFRGVLTCVRRSEHLEIILKTSFLFDVYKISWLIAKKRNKYP